MTSAAETSSSHLEKLINSRAARIVVWSFILLILLIVAYRTHMMLWQSDGHHYTSQRKLFIWITYLISWGLILVILWRTVSNAIYSLVAPADDSEGKDKNNRGNKKKLDPYEDEKDQARKLAKIIAFSIIVGSILITMLFVLDHQGHAAITSDNNGGSQHLTAEINRSSPATSLQTFAKAAGPHLGTFGDFFGGVLNPLLTFGTLIGLAVTILMQRIQIREARAEARASNSHAQTQAFETTFFHLLNLHAENIQNLTFDPNVVPIPPSAPEIELFKRRAGIAPAPIERPPMVHGRAVFGEVLRRTRRGASSGQSQLDVYRSLQRQHNDVLGHYFRHLYQILNLINSFAVEGNEDERYRTRKRYTNILRAQMSAHELAVLLLNCTFRTVDDGKFRDLLVWYKFLEHLPIQERQGDIFISNIDLNVQWIVYDYFDVSGEKDRIWLSGAFGKNPVVRKYLNLQGPTWRGPVPWKAATTNS